MLEEAKEMDNTYFLFTSVRSYCRTLSAVQKKKSGAELS